MRRKEAVLRGAKGYTRQLKILLVCVSDYKSQVVFLTKGTGHYKLQQLQGVVTTAHCKCFCGKWKFSSHTFVVVFTKDSNVLHFVVVLTTAKGSLNCTSKYTDMRKYPTDAKIFGRF